MLGLMLVDIKVDVGRCWGWFWLVLELAGTVLVLDLIRIFAKFE